MKVYSIEAHPPGGQYKVWASPSTSKGGTLAYVKREKKSWPAGTRFKITSEDDNPKRNPGKSVRLSNFTGTIRKNANGTVQIKGRAKRK